MKFAVYKDRKIRATSKGYFYLDMPKSLVESLPSKIVTMERTEAGILLKPVVKIDN